MITKYSILSDYHINLAAFIKSSQVLGPGNRAIIYVQGCPFRCEQCLAKDWLDFRPAKLISIQKLADEILNLPTITGVTISGGEPFMQAPALAELLRYLRSYREMDFISFSGFRIEQLMANPEKSGFMDYLEQLDVLIDGQFVPSLNDGKGMRGSSNQRIHYLSDRLRGYPFEEKSREIEIHIIDGQLLMTGVPPKGIDSGFFDTILNPASLVSDLRNP